MYPHRSCVPTKMLCTHTDVVYPHKCCVPTQMLCTQTGVVCPQGCCVPTNSQTTIIGGVSHPPNTPLHHSPVQQHTHCSAGAPTLGQFGLKTVFFYTVLGGQWWGRGWVVARYSDRGGAKKQWISFIFAVRLYIKFIRNLKFNVR